MRILFAFSPVIAAGVLAFPSFVAGQNAAPVQKNVPANVAPADAKTASQEAVAVRQGANSSAPGGQTPEGQTRVLDSVVAIINGDVLLESDVEEEQRLESLQMLPTGENTIVHAAQNLITITLILQQMKAQQQTSPDITDVQVSKTVDDLRKELPGCAAAHCDTDAGWNAFLKGKGLTPEEVNDRWRQRLVILDYLNLRFRSGIRIPAADVATYYQTKMVPEFDKKHQKAPPLKELTPRIREVLLQEQVSKQIDDWEATLRQEGSVQILVPAYGKSTGDNDDNGGGA